MNHDVVAVPPVDRPTPELDRVVVLAGGLTPEREVSLRSGRRVVDALRVVGVEATLRDSDAALLLELESAPPTAAFIALHGGPGEDGAIRGVLDLFGVPYVGAGPAASRLAFDKPSAKAAVRAAGLATPDWLALPHSTFRELGAATLLDRIVKRFGLPLMVKPARGGSALGTVQVTEPADLPAAMVGCFSYGDTALVEPYVAGRELAVGVVETQAGRTALPAVEVVPVGGVFDYTARYTAGATDYYTPARVDADTAAQAAAAAALAHRALGLRDLSRTDLILDAEGRLQFLEVNVAPGMTETSLLPMGAAAAGLSLGELCRDLLGRAAARGPARSLP